MSVVRPKARASATFKVALLAGLLLSQASLFAEHLYSTCLTIPRLHSALPKSKRNIFTVHASLRDYAATRSSFPLAAITPTSSILATASVFDSDTALEGSLLTDLSGADNPTISSHISAARLKLTSETTALPHILSWLDGWRMDVERGLFRPLRLRATRLAFAYTDIFDTRGHPDKGSHGLGILFRYDFRKAPDRR